MDTTLDVKVTFKDGGDPMTIRDKDLFKQLPILERAVSAQNPDWERENTVVTMPLFVPFPREFAEFIFEHVRSYESPEKRGEPDTPASVYAEANEKTLDELKYIIELANFLECADFVKCMGVVIAKKLEDWDVKKIAEYLGLDCDAEDDYDEDNEWMHPPLAVLQPAPNPAPARIAAPAPAVVDDESDSDSDARSMDGLNDGADGEDAGDAEGNDDDAAAAN